MPDIRRAHVRTTYIPCVHAYACVSRALQTQKSEMGAGESTQESSSNYDVNERSNQEVLELPQDFKQGPIHSLAVVDQQHLLSGGTDKVNHLYSNP